MEQVQEDILGEVAPIVRVAHVIVERAVDANATELHLIRGTDEMELYYRIGADLHRDIVLPAHIYPRLVTRYKVGRSRRGAGRLPPAV